MDDACTWIFHTADTVHTIIISARHSYTSSAITYKHHDVQLHLLRIRLMFSLFIITMLFQRVLIVEFQSEGRISNCVALQHEPTAFVN